MKLGLYLYMSKQNFYIKNLLSTKSTMSKESFGVIQFMRSWILEIILLPEDLYVFLHVNK